MLHQGAVLAIDSKGIELNTQLTLREVYLRRLHQNKMQAPAAAVSMMA